MANIESSIALLMTLEHPNLKKALHKNSGENGYTYKGIYQSEHPHWIGWNFINDALKINRHNLPKTSLYLEQGEYLQKAVKFFYKNEFWNLAKLDQVNSQDIAEEIFIFGVNTGMRNAIRKAQKLVGAEDDGFVGDETLEALNRANVKDFDMEFDEVEKQYYDAVIKRKPYLAINKKGWYNRADAV